MEVSSSIWHSARVCDGCTLPAGPNMTAMGRMERKERGSNGDRWNKEGGKVKAWRETNMEKLASVGLPAPVIVGS